MDTLVEYGRVIFVDAHVYETLEDLHCAPVVPEYAPSTFTHHLTPAALLSPAQNPLRGRTAGRISFPSAAMISIFTANLSEKTRALVEPAADCILRILK